MSLTAIADLLQARLGLEPESLGPAALSAAVETRVRALGLTDPAAYAGHLAGSDDEFAALVDEVVVPETWFFRGGELFSYLVQHIRDASRLRAPGRPFRILSAPCSSGEEPYSLVLALTEAGVPPALWTVDGIDVSRRSVDRARRGRYGEGAFRETPDSLRRRHFTRFEDGWEIASAVRSAVRFRSANLIDPGCLAGEPPFDLILCRNLLIYLIPSARERMMNVVVQFLAPGGLLCMGHAEALIPLERGFRSIGPTGYFLFQRHQPLATPRPPAAPTLSPPVRSPSILLATPIAAPVATALPLSGRTTVPDLLARARQQADAGEIDAALGTCRALQAAAGPSAELYSLLGVLHQVRQESAEALACFRKALYLKPDHHEAMTHLMLLYEQMGNRTAAAQLRRRLEQAAAGGES
jgi:chemotaxis protein methyltransferase WspC